MDPPPLTPSSTTTTTTVTTPDSANSSPCSKASTGSFDDSHQLISTITSSKLRLMCSFNGHIIPRPHDKSLCYIGGDTRIVVVDRHSSLSQLTHRLSEILLNCTNHEDSFSLKYQLPSEDLDSLISVTTDEDLENMIQEYDRLNINNSSARLRLFLFPVKPESSCSIGSLLENSEDWFLNALNGTNSGELSNSNSVNCLLGPNDNVLMGITPKSNKNQDVHSVPDSLMLDETSSFGSASSTPKSFPSIKVKVADDQQRKVGIEEQFARMGVDGDVNRKWEDGGLEVAVEAVAVSSGQVVVDYSSQVLANNDYRRQLQQQQAQLMASNLCQKRDLASPDSVSSDGSITNPLSHQKPMMYQDPNIQYQLVQSRVSVTPVEQNISDPRFHQVQQQFQDSGYMLPTQFDPQSHQKLHQQQPQLINVGSQYIQHVPAGAVPIPSYYPVYSSQQPQHSQHPPLEQQYPVYYMPARQTQAYNMPVHTDYNEAAGATPSGSGHPQAVPSAAMVLPSAHQYNIARYATPPISEVPGGYRTANAAAASVVQIPTGQPQPQYLGFSQTQQPQSITQTSATTTSYAYEFADPTQAHVYYAQPLAPRMAAQYQTMTSASPEAAAQLPVEASGTIELCSLNR